MTATLAPFPADKLEAHADNPTAQGITPLLETAYAEVAQIVDQISVLGKARENAEAELENSDTPEANALREAQAVVERNKQAEKDALAREEEEHKARKEAIKARFAAVKEQETKLKEARAAAIVAEAAKKVQGVNVDALQEQYKAKTSYVNLLAAPLSAVGIDVKFSFPTFQALASPKSFGNGSVTSGERKWRPRFITIYVNGEQIESKTSPKTGRVSTQLEDAAKKAGVSADSIKTILENRLGGRAFPEGSLDDEGFYTFHVDHNGKDIEFKVQPQVKNTEDTEVDQDNDTE